MLRKYAIKHLNIYKLLIVCFPCSVSSTYSKPMNKDAVFTILFEDFCPMNLALRVPESGAPFWHLMFINICY